MVPAGLPGRLRSVGSPETKDGGAHRVVGSVASPSSCGYQHVCGRWAHGGRRLAGPGRVSLESAGHSSACGRGALRCWGGWPCPAPALEPSRASFGEAVRNAHGRDWRQRRPCRFDEGAIGDPPSQAADAGHLPSIELTLAPSNPRKPGVHRSPGARARSAANACGRHEVLNLPSQAAPSTAGSLTSLCPVACIFGLRSPCFACACSSEFDVFFRPSS